MVERDQFIYELHAPLRGIDLYRDAVSWSPFGCEQHARAAGFALARFHRAARDFALPPRPRGVLRDAAELSRSHDPLRSLDAWFRDRPALHTALMSRGFDRDFSIHLKAPLGRASEAVSSMTSQWTHGDWHASNLSWSSADPSATVVEAFDLGLSNRTFAMHDLALAVERNTIDWLDLANQGALSVDLAAIDAMLSGYAAHCPLSSAELGALVAVLPVVHVEYALSELEYFAAIANHPNDADLAYAYLIGHATWFSSDAGAALLEHIRGWSPTGSFRANR
jgi:Ser/Thr protein kinase RdoA (MazF antagonist)